MAHLCPLLKKKTWWDSTIRKDWKGDTLQSEEEKHGIWEIYKRQDGKLDVKLV